MIRVHKRSFAAALVFCAGCSRPIDLSPEIANIKAIDNHAHPVRPGEPKDTEYDALPVESLEPSSDPVRMREPHPKLPHGDAVRTLDQLGIDIMLANRVAMGPGLSPERFRWVPYVDALMYPLPNEPLIHNSDQRAFFADEDRLLKRYYSESGVASRPASLDDYLNKVVLPTIQRHKQGGAVAEKFEMAYLRPLDIGNPTRDDAEKAWSGRGDYKALQDYIFRAIASECGRLGMAVHFHTGAGGGSYFNVEGSNPMLLDPVFNDPSLRKTNFVMLHGGWPFTRQLTALLAKPNVYLDFSAQTLFEQPREVAATVRAWLEYVPEKVLFATDAYPYSEDLGWEETGSIAVNTTRQALNIALTGMLADGEITRDRALELARMVLRDNAIKLYNLK